MAVGVSMVSVLLVRSHRLVVVSVAAALAVGELEPEGLAQEENGHAQTGNDEKNELDLALPLVQLRLGRVVDLGTLFRAFMKRRVRVKKQKARSSD